MKIIPNGSIVVLLVVILSFSSLGVLNVNAQEDEAIKNIVLTFLEEVVQLDMTQYESRVTNLDITNWIANQTTITGQYNLLSITTGPEGSSLITGIFTIVNNKIAHCKSTYKQKPPIFIEQPEDPVEKALGFLQKYQTFTNDPEVATMKNILETINPKISITTIIDNIKLEVEYESDETDFNFSNNYNGADFSRLKLGYENGLFDDFYDDRSYTKIGSTEVNISEEQAITLALQETSTYMFECENGTVLELGFIEEFIKAELKVIPKGNQGEYYPIWIIDVPLDRMYGHISYFTIMLWADNGEIREVIPLGSGVGLMDPDQLIAGTLIEASNPSPSISPTPTGLPPIRFYNPYLILFGSTLLLIALGILAYYKKYKRKDK